MSAPVQPSDLYFRLQDALGDLRELKRTVTDLAREYVDLDATELAVDDLGSELTPSEALTQTLAGLASIDQALDNSDDAFDTTMQTASRLLRPNLTPATDPNL
ncbi:hypothetical protein GS894_23835 [Rhodococcus hoagii]|nr:hypothetical protein [Prescottella equi]NKT12020.1 hypothetical protein [Prescottella equi]NKT16260.1 hypothetical protein [Prescottella equi]NKT36051.1 hypothetical protein [Prescottella equi]NKT37657.1 hypothetical protein [Prescottella equi]